jgi:methionyl-tRNA formyltransferase
VSDLRIAFAGDRDISVWVLAYLLGQAVKPLALCVSGGARASHATELIALCSHLPPEMILKGAQFRQPSGLQLLRELDLDYLIGVHFPYRVPESVLSIPRIGALNLHPAYLPYNRGWHTPSWALLEGTPIGATLHFMDAGIDTGDIVHQRALLPTPGDTANTLYRRIKKLELETFQEAWPYIAAGAYQRMAQGPLAGAAHQRQDLFAQDVQRIDLDAQVNAGELIRRLRALTTNRVDEAAYYEVNGRRYRVQVAVSEEEG